MSTRFTLSFALLLLVLLPPAAPALEGARYLIIAGDDLVPALEPLAAWKTAKGMAARVVPLSVAGSTPDSVRGYIRNAWQTWPVPPEFVVIAGGPSYLRFPGNAYDCRFGDVTGDYRVELPVGRLWVRNVTECSTIVAKTLAYERPSLADTAWFRSGTTVVREDDDDDDTVYWNDSRACHEWWTGAAYLTIDSLSKNRGHSGDDVTAAANRGTAFITYRGQCGGNWWPPFGDIDPYTWSNGERLPIVVGATCASIMVETMWSWFSDKLIRAVSAGELGGGVAYFGTTLTDGHPPERSAGLRGFMRSLFGEGEYRLGRATERARGWVDTLFPGVQNRYEEWTLLGDPELGVWTGVPQVLDVTCDTAIDLGPQDYTVTVYTDGSPVIGAVACVSMDSSVHEYGTSGFDGRVVLEIDPTHNGPMRVVVTGRNLLPYDDTCLVGQVGLAGQERLPVSLELEVQALARGMVTVRYSVVRPGSLELSVYDAGGRSVQVLERGWRGPGEYRAVLDASRLARGAYFCRLVAAGSTRVRKLVRVE